MGKKSSLGGEENRHSDGTLSVHTNPQFQSRILDRIDPRENGIPAIQRTELDPSDAAPWCVLKKTQPKTRMIA